MKLSDEVTKLAFISLRLKVHSFVTAVHSQLTHFETCPELCRQII